jgi:hypothetical protein
MSKCLSPASIGYTAYSLELYPWDVDDVLGLHCNFQNKLDPHLKRQAWCPMGHSLLEQNIDLIWAKSLEETENIGRRGGFLPSVVPRDTCYALKSQKERSELMII